MKVDGVPTRTIAREPGGWAIRVIDQTRLLHDFVTTVLGTVEDAARAIRTMQVRGAPLIGATAAYGLALALRADPSDRGLRRAYEALLATRPTAINLRWALDAVRAAVAPRPELERAVAAFARADAICADDVATNQAIGHHGLALIRAAHERRGKSGPINVLTHCNAGWLACVDWGTALAPVYLAHDAGIPVHVWVGETRPRNQGAALTAWELGRHGVPHTVVVDSAGGHLMQRGLVDLCLVGTDRTAANGDVANKIGTYLKALAAHDNGVPFHVALPSSTIDWTIDDGAAIPIEQRATDEVTHVTGLAVDGRHENVRVAPLGSAAANPAFDVTPARLVTSLINERGASPASRERLLALFPERRAA